MKLAFVEAAVDELVAGAAFYEREREGYGSLFYEEVEAAVELAAVHPSSGRPVRGTPEELDVRTHALRRFPFLMVTAQLDAARVVIALAHTSREPGYWRNRAR